MNSLPYQHLIIKILHYGFILSCCFFFGCEKNTEENSLVHTPYTTAIPNLHVANPAFFIDLHTNSHAFIAGSDGTIIFSDANVPAQTTPTPNHAWQAVNVPTGKNILALASDEEATNLIAVGEDGLILHSQNAGKNWQIKTSGTHKKLHSIVFDPEYKTWVSVGEQGTILQGKTNQFDHWNIIDAGQQATLSGIYYVAAQKKLLAIGENGVLLVSDDGGNQWQTIALQTEATLTGLVSINPQTIIITCADGSILRSEKTVTEWELIATSSAAFPTGLIYDPLHNTTIVLTADGEILISDDGGKLWAPVANIHEYLTDVTLIDAGKKLLASSANGSLLQSDNGGRTWVNLPAVTSASIDGILTLNDERVVAYGEGGLLIQSNDAGNNWTLLNTPVNDFVHQLLKVDTNNWLAVGAKGLLLNSNNHGQNWQAIASIQQKTDYLLSIIRDQKSGALITAGPPGTILVSTDMGKTWRVRLALGDASKGYFHQLLGDNQGTLVALAGPGTNHYSSDAGETWAISESDNSKQLFAGIYDQANQQFIAVGQAGAIQISPDGRIWQAIEAGISQNLQTVYADKNTLWIGGEQGLLLRSDNAGLNWIPITTETTNTILSITQLRGGTLLATGNNGLILRSTDAGENWQLISAPVNDMLRKPLQDAATDITYIASRSGTIIYSRDAGQHWAAMDAFTQASIKTLAIDADTKMLLGGGERLIHIPLLTD